MRDKQDVDRPTHLCSRLSDLVLLGKFNFGGKFILQTL